MSSQAQHLIAHLCQRSVNARFRASNALEHPWITRDLHKALPMSDQQIRQLAIDTYPLETKLRKAMRVALFASINLRQRKVLKQEAL